MRPHRLDLFPSDRLPLRPHQRGKCRNLRLGGMDHGQENLDDYGRIRQRARRKRRLRNQALPHGKPGFGRRRLSADVKVEPLDLGAADLACRHKVMERVMDAEPETILKPCVSVARRAFVTR